MTRRSADSKSKLPKLDRKTIKDLDTKGTGDDVKGGLVSNSGGGRIVPPVSASCNGSI